MANRKLGRDYEVNFPIFKRKIYDDLLYWKEHSNGRTALLVEGARRIGKTTIVEEFARHEYDSYIVVDFSTVSNSVKELFAESGDDLDLLLDTLQSLNKVRLTERRSLIIFDEVQQFPLARQMIKQFVADGRYDYIETGSLIRLRKNVKNILIPSEEEKIRMYPMDFEEFLWATGDTTTMPYIRKCFDEKKAVGNVLHPRFMRDFRTYLLVGGMPQSVAAYLGRRKFEDADLAKRAVLSLYHDDIYKYSEGEEAKVVAIFDGIPGQLSKKSKRFMLSSLDSEARSRSYETAFRWLNEAMIVNSCYDVTDPSAGLALTEDATNAKCYMGDTGLLVTKAFDGKPYLSNEIYRAILLDKLGINEGMIVENYVAQTLRSLGYGLYYYATTDQDDPAGDMEVDFVIVQDNKLNPIEVKSGNYRRHSSLDKFKKKFGKKVGQRYVLHTKDFKIDGDVMYLPLYMAGLL